MERASHTPGPWGLKPCSHGGLILLRDGITQSHLQIAPEADARLIAAAPDLLAALEEVAVTLDKWKGQAYVDLANVARRATTKAKGEA